mgnify:CR=1 FL=1
MTQPVEELPDHQIEQLMTIEEVAAIYRVPVSAIRRWRENGEPPHGFRVGKHIRWSAQAVREDLARRSAGEAIAG